MCAVEDPIDWYAEARLFLRSGVRGEWTTELFRGHIADAVHAALARPEEERSRLFICCETLDRKLPWAKIVRLSERPDFPVLI